MSLLRRKTFFAVGAILASAASAQNEVASSVTSGSSPTTTAPTCESTIEPMYGAPSVAAGWNARVIASGLTEPRGLVFDSEGRLLVVQQRVGLSGMRIVEGDGGCVRVDGEIEALVENEDLNHGIELSEDGRTLYASSATSVYAWDYDASTGRTTSDPREIIGDIGEDQSHTSRTLLLSRHTPGMLLVSRGSVGNLDPTALDASTGVSTIKGFNISESRNQSYSFQQDGLLLGWGLRNSVGVAEDPATGGIWSVENSVDNIERSGQTFNQNNPGEELNFHGYLNGTETAEQGGNYGYPTCFAAWGVDEIPNNENVQVGTQFAIGDQNATLNDSFCRDERVAPRLTFSAHTAPLDIKFNTRANAAWVTFHGSWNRDDPIGYDLSVIAFENGIPTEPANSTSAAIPIVSNPDLSRCPNECLRPVGLAWDSQGRLFMTSDSTGEIYVITRTEGGSVDDASPGNGIPASPAGTDEEGSSGRQYGCLQKVAVLFASVVGLSLL